MNKCFQSVYCIFYSIENIFHFIAKFLLITFLVLLSGLLLILFIYMSDSFINDMTGNSKKPLFGAYVVMSGSMDPVIQIKDGIFIRRVDNNHYNIGDIITFLPVDSRYGKATITHRVVEKRQIDDGKYVYKTKGDHNTKMDSDTVLSENIYGKVLFKIPKIGYVQDFLAKPSNYFSCLLVFALLFIIYHTGKILLLFVKEKIA